MILLQRPYGLAAHHRFRGRLQFPSDQQNFLFHRHKPLRMGNGIGHKRNIFLSNIIQHICGCSTRIQIYKVFRLYEGCRILCNPFFLLTVQILFLGYGIFICRHLVPGGRHRAAKHFHQLPLPVKHGDIPAYGRFRSTQYLFGLRYGNASPFFQKFQYLFVTFLC